MKMVKELSFRNTARSFSNARVCLELSVAGESSSKTFQENAPLFGSNIIRIRSGTALPEGTVASTLTSQFNLNLA